MDVNFYSLIIAAVVGVAAGFVGSLMVLKKMALVGDALSHVALPGLALGILFNFEPFIGAFAFLFARAHDHLFNRISTSERKIKKINQNRTHLSRLK